MTGSILKPVFNTLILHLVKISVNMRMTLLTLAGLLFFGNVRSQDLKAFQIYDKNKSAVSFYEMADALSRYNVVLFGEYHNNSIIHWLQLQTEKELYKLKDGKLILGAEMFERDNQTQIDQYLAGEIDEKELTKEARLWNNFKTDYKPLLDFAREHQLPFVAANIPRRYASIVARHGLDSLNNLPDNEKVYIARSPIRVDLETPGYPEMLDMMKDHAGDNAMNFVAAQAIKDATMAESILKSLKRKHLLLHFEGDYHSKEYGGIYWYLKKMKKRLKVAVISVAESEVRDLLLPDGFVATEFNIVVPADMTKTY